MEKQPYRSRAECGFCRFYGQIFTERRQDVCAECEIRHIREGLSTLVDAKYWEHDHQYQLDIDPELRNCAHCKHALPITTRYRAAGYGDEVWCARDGDALGDDEKYPTHSAFSTCAKWERAVDPGAKEDS